MTLHDHQVLQRDANNEAAGLAVGGPYEIDGIHDVLVGDLWVLAGQSNMEGVGDLVDVETPLPFVHSYQSRERWAVAEEPLHWLGESPQLVHHKLGGREQVPDEPDPRDIGRIKGAGLGLTFAKTRYAQTGIPVGLIPSAHGGTSMQQWDPARKGEGGGSLYGATLSRFQSTGGKVAGILWYQGESDANPNDLPLYKDRMTKLVQSFRADFGQPNLPFYIVQIGCFAVGRDPGDGGRLERHPRSPADMGGDAPAHGDGLSHRPRIRRRHPYRYAGPEAAWEAACCRRRRLLCPGPARCRPGSRRQADPGHI